MDETTKINSYEFRHFQNSLQALLKDIIIFIIGSVYYQTFKMAGTFDHLPEVLLAVRSTPSVKGNG